MSRLFIAIVLTLSSVAYATTDSILNRVVAQFRSGERSKIYCGNMVYSIRVKGNTKEPALLAFYVKLPEQIRDGDELPVSVERKGKFSGRYRDVNHHIPYESSIKFLVLHRSYR